MAEKMEAIRTMAGIWGKVKDHRGYIDMDSWEGAGSTFILYFPVTRQEKAAAPRAVLRTDYLGRGETILVVDDVLEQREAVYFALSALRSSSFRTASPSFSKT
jgi:hypoxanthine phosphoribosyltransferase